jgi:hypothetical protein
LAAPSFARPFRAIPRKSFFHDWSSILATMPRAEGRWKTTPFCREYKPARYASDASGRNARVAAG